MTSTSRRLTTQAAQSAARLGSGDLAALASIGLRTRQLRAGLQQLRVGGGVVSADGLAGLQEHGDLVKLSCLFFMKTSTTNFMKPARHKSTATRGSPARGKPDRARGVTDAHLLLCS